ncbi:MAG: hypothetical protein CO113_11785 [Elusimicrobia bacterium CG_4_9_14_3_um_filter_62_55]|nr:MAG: hypothetical protein COR54_16740 [Elusimicrobia bacterium CG22_combo_CG10-13_8_21_14_all_63_91]PJA15844.1 MAG: hypothetical protein COX66_08990 [Elusimicrobia bacterium CG_4_10_14_0_2_um_filter_63_34]PJB24832.1 MAG: hypothetical protein CO113_11785 [Elusimicrobia bacterium CG_4_9_14_3_um_filter_62_55]
MHYFLLDANVLVPYYCDDGEDRSVRRRIGELMACCAAKKVFLFVPNFCVAEVLKAFAKKCWQEKIYGGRASDAREAFDKFREAFLDDVVDSKLLYSYELSRRHIRRSDEIYEAAAKHSFREGAFPSAFDVLIVSMGMNLARIHGPKGLTIITADRPIYDIYRTDVKFFPHTINILETDIPKDLL